MSHGCHTCHCPNGCRCDKLAKEARIRAELGSELFDALVVLGAAEAERNRLEWALRKSEDVVADCLETVKNLVGDQDLDDNEVEVGSDIWRGLSLLKRP